MDGDVRQNGKNNINARDIKNIYNIDNINCDGSAKVKAFSEAVKDDSFILEESTPKIQPAIPRPEIRKILSWIEKEPEKDNPSGTDRLALVTGSPGIGKTVVMNGLFKAASRREDYLVWGIKADQLASSEILQRDNINVYRGAGTTILDEIRKIQTSYKRIVIIVDQLDALSLSLGSDRQLFQTFLNLVRHLTTLGNVRVVISCRLYDLKYDPLLSEMRLGALEWTVGKLPSETVISVLSVNGYQKELQPEVIDILGNPLLLYLFLKVKDLLTDVTELNLEKLYDLYWDLNLKEDPDRIRLIEAVDAIADNMKADQRLTVGKSRVAEYQQEISRLSTYGFLVESDRSDSISFFHQTLFEYVAARRFLERKQSLEAELLSGHEGLFIRPMLKSILDYQRSHDTSVYMSSIRRIIGNDDKGGCRYHLKHMVVTSLGYRQNPLPAEKILVGKTLWERKELIIPFLESVNSREWLTFVRELVRTRGGFGNLDPDRRGALLTACRNLIYGSGDLAIGYLLEFYEEGDDTVRNSIVSILEYARCGCDTQPLKKIITYFRRKSPEIQFHHLLRIISPTDPEFVESELMSDISGRIKKTKASKYSRLELDYETSSIFEQLEKHHPGRTLPFLVKVLRLVARGSELSIPGYAYKFSTGIFLREGTGISHYDYIEHLPHHIAEIAASRINDDKAQVVETALALVRGTNHIEAYAGLTIMADNNKELSREAYESLLTLPLIGINPSWVIYGVGKLIEKLLPVLSDDEKKSLIDKVMSIPVQKARLDVKGLSLAERLDGDGTSLSMCGLEKGILLKRFGEAELKRLDPEAYKELGRLSRKLKYLDNRPPSYFSSSVGFGSLPHEKVEKMSDSQWLSAMKRYNTDRMPHLGTPTLEGQARRLTALVTEKPDDYINLSKEVVADKEISLRYSIAMLEGFVKSGRPEYARQTLEGMIGAVNSDLNSKDRGFSLHSVLFALYDFFQKEECPEYFFRFLCRAAMEADDAGDDATDNASDNAGDDAGDPARTISFFETTAINTTRGNAVSHLIRFMGKGYDDEAIFGILEKIAINSSVTTRGAALLYLAVALRIDRARTLRLFLSLNHDYDPRLMSLPFHNLNPLPYLVKTDFDKLEDYFCHAVSQDVYLPSVMQTLWFALSYSRNQKAREYLEIMLEKWDSAKAELVDFINKNEDYSDVSMEYLKRFMAESSPSPKLARSLDGIFFRIDKEQPEFIVLLEAYSDSASCGLENRDFFKALASFVSTDPEKTLELLARTVTMEKIDDQLTWNTITETLLQSYNGIKNLEDESLSDILEKAMDILDYIMKKSISSREINLFTKMLDN